MNPACLDLPETMDELRELWLHTTYQCNLTCGHCLFSCSPEREPEALSFAEACKRTCEGEALGVGHFYITGGESLLWPALKDYLAWYFEEIGKPLTILSNGTLIDDGWADLLAAYGPQGLSLRISLECYTQKTNDQWRGMGSFAKATEGIRRLNERGMLPWVAYTNKGGAGLSPCQAQGLEKDFRERLEKDFGLKIAGLKVISGYAMGRHRTIAAQGPKNPMKGIKPQCYYGLAVSSRGLAQCPILIEVPTEEQGMAERLTRPINLDYDCCGNCLATGTSCGQ